MQTYCLNLKNSIPLFLFIGFFLCGSNINGQQSLLVDKVIAKVGSEYILNSEIEDEFNYAKTQNPALEDNVKCFILESIIDQKVIIYQAILDSVEVLDQEVDMQLDFRFDAVLRQMNGDEEFFKDYYGATIKEMKERYRDDQKQKLLAEKMQYELISNVEITPKEVAIFFNSIPADSLPYFKSDLEISEIILKPNVNPSEHKKAFEKITEIRNLIISGKETFEKMAIKHSQDPGSGARGGDLGFAKRGSYVPEFEATVFSLQKDEISDIIETEFGFHFIQLLERRGNSVKARHILIKPEITKDDLKETKAKLENVKKMIDSDSISFEQAVKEYSLKTLPSYSNNGRVKNQNNNSTFFAADDLDAQTYFAVFELKPGQTSVVDETILPGGEKAYRLIKLISMSKPHKANLKEDYYKIATFAKESKKNEYFAKWLDDRRKDMYIYVDPIYADCPNIKAIKD